ncbi:MAG TPA: 4Fe-4S dicluster domain-containing protein [Armatimonadetes bacterium]|nr:4Fe-4S dicluster domain-containing protein [Armatimonadota bacterium]
MPFVVIDGERCKGCGLCVAFCPKGALGLSNELNAKGAHPAELKHPERCTGCRHCALMCPEVCIEVYIEPRGRAKGGGK